MRTSAQTIALTLAVVLLVAAGVAFYGDRVVPGTRAAGVSVGGLSRDGVALALAPAAVRFAALPLIVRGDGREWVSTNAALGIELDIDGLLLEASEARSGLDLGWPRRASGAGLDGFLGRIATEVARDPVEGSVAIGAGGVEVVEPVDGARLDPASLRGRILADRAAVAVIAFEPTSVPPVLDTLAIADARTAAISAYAPLAVRAGSERILLTADLIASAVRIDRTPSGDRLVASLDDAALTALADEVASRLDGPARDAVLVPGGERLRVIAGRDAVAVDVAGARDALAAAIFGSAGADREIEVPAATLPAAFSTAAAEELAATLRLAGSYTTFFPVNPSRDTNIRLGAAAFDGVVLAPGERFSFWDRIGEVSQRTGYVDAGAILGGVSASAIGGGLCQVSTTLFNAVARAGLRIDERHQHSYYIARYPVGMDAAVFFPSADLVWTNDTGVPVMINSATTSTSVSFWIYSAPTGRTAIFPEPVQRNFRSPAPTQPADPAHPPGYVVPGRDVWATRIVYEDGAELWTDVWYSHYAPVWGGPAR